MNDDQPVGVHHRRFLQLSHLVHHVVFIQPPINLISFHHMPILYRKRLLLDCVQHRHCHFSHQPHIQHRQHRCMIRHRPVFQRLIKIVVQQQLYHLHHPYQIVHRQGYNLPAPVNRIIVVAVVAVLLDATVPQIFYLIRLYAGSILPIHMLSLAMMQPQLRLW